MNDEIKFEAELEYATKGLVVEVPNTMRVYPGKRYRVTLELAEKPESCPFCGGRPWTHRIPNTESYAAMCSRCAARGPMTYSKANALDAWNRRHKPTYHDVEEYYRD